MKTSRTQNYFRGLASSYVVILLSILVSLWLTPFTLRFLDREEFAIFTLASDVLMWLGLLDIGLASVLTVKAAQLSSRPDQASLNKLVSTTFFGQCGIALAMALSGIGFSLYFPEFFSVRPDLYLEAMLVMVLMVVGSTFTVATQTFSVLLIAHQQMHIDNLIRLGLLAIRTVLTVWLLIEGVGLVSLAIANVVAVIATGGLAIIRVHRLLPALRIRWQFFSWELLKSTAGVSLWFSLGGVAGILIMYLDKIVTAKLISVEMVTTLALSGKLYALAWTVIQQISGYARPALAQIIGSQDMALAKVKYHQLVALSTGTAIVFALSIWSGNGSFVPWWVGSVNYGGPLLDAALAANLIVHCWVLPNRAVLVSGLAFVPENSVSRFIEGLLNFALAILLGMNWGVVGVVVSTALSGILTTCWYIPRLTARFFLVKFTSLIINDFCRLVFLIGLLAPVAFVSRMAGNDIGGLFGSIVGAGICFSIGLIFLWYLVLGDDNRKQILLTFKARWLRDNAV